MYPLQIRKEGCILQQIEGDKQMFLLLHKCQGKLAGIPSGNGSEKHLSKIDTSVKNNASDLRAVK